MRECPYCGSDLKGSANVSKKRGGDPLGGKTRHTALVSCPDCGEVIDGFKAH
ncbi:MAG: hypothetical protein V5A23_07185 [Halobacteriales archaeon]